MFLKCNHSSLVPFIRFTPNVDFIKSKLEGNIGDIKEEVGVAVRKVVSTKTFPITVTISAGDITATEQISTNHIVAIADRLEQKTTITLPTRVVKVDKEDKVSNLSYEAYLEGVLRITPLCEMIKGYIDKEISDKMCTLGKSRSLVIQKQLDLHKQIARFDDTPWIVSCLYDDAIISIGGDMYLYDVKLGFREDLLDSLSIDQLPDSIRSNYPWLKDINSTPELPDDSDLFSLADLHLENFCFHGDCWFRLNDKKLTRQIDSKLIDLINFEKSGLSMIMMDLAHFIYDNQTMSIEELGNSVYKIGTGINKLHGIKDRRKVKDMLNSIADFPSLYRLEVKNDADIVFSLVQERNVGYSINNKSTDKIASMKYIPNLRLTNLLLWEPYLTKWGLGIVATPDDVTITSIDKSIHLVIVGDNEISKFSLNYLFNHNIEELQNNVKSLYLLYQLVMCTMSDDSFVLDDNTGLITAEINSTLVKRFVKPYIVDTFIEVVV